jgi:hypothetical protein
MEENRESFMNTSIRHPMRIILLVGGFLLLASIGAYALMVAAPTPASTSKAPPAPAATSSAPGWLTYRDQSGVFSFQYPSTFQVGQDGSDTIVFAKSATTPYEGALDFSPLLTRTDATPTTYSFAHNGLPPNYSGYEYDRASTINGATAYEYGVLHGSGTFAHVFFLKDQNHGIDATYEWTSPLAPDFANTLATFRFIGS